jgi:hypothetical protein
MDTSSFFAVGEQLEGFLTKQFTPPDGTQAVLGFFGSGLAVEPGSFIGDDGKYNPARVNTWLNISLDVVNAVEDHRVGSAVMSASQLIQAIGVSAMSTSPIASETALVLGRMKSQVMEDLGGATVIQTAPLNWYDPAQVAQWPNYGMKIGSDTPPAPTPTPAPGGKIPIDRPPLWVWRTLARPRPETFIPVHPEVTAVHSQVPVAQSLPHSIIQPTSAKVLNVSAMHAVTPMLHMEQPVMHVMAAPVQQTLAVQPTQTLHLASSTVAFNNAVKTAADQASAQRVDAPSMSVDLNYCMVGLSRTPWWNDLLIGMTNWYVPGQHKDSWIGKGAASRCFGLPVSLILTANVRIKAAWSQSDRASAANSSHVGPWSLAGSQFPAPDSTGAATLTIPSMQAIGCIYRVLPSLPPVDDPALAVQNSGASAPAS